MMSVAVGMADNGSSWRFFTSRDGLHDSYATAVTWSSRGNVWVKHGEFDSLSMLDGYDVKTLPSPGGGGNRVYESRSGQLWTLYSEGLAEFRRGRWVQHPIETIRLEIQTNLTRHVRPIPLVPAERDRVFFLLTDRLVEYVWPSGRLTTIVRASDTRLESFIDMMERRDGSIWITGRKGLIRYEGPARQVRPESRPEEFLVPERYGVRDLHRPVEDARGGITMMAELRTAESRAVVEFLRGEWQMQSTGAEKVRYGWHGAGGVIWLQTINKLLRLIPDETGESTVTREELNAGQFFDVSAAPGGAFWMATSDGLARYTPLPWQVPAGLSDSGGSYHAIHEEKTGELWFAGSTGLARQKADAWEIYSWPSDVEPAFRPGDSLFALPDGRLVFNAPERIGVFDPRSTRYEASVSAGAGGRVIRRVIGRFGDGALAVVLSLGSGRDWGELARWDGGVPRVLMERRLLTGGVGDIQFAQSTSDGSLWVGGSAGLFRCRDGSGNSFERAEAFRSDRAYCLSETVMGRILCGAGDVVWEFDGVRWTVMGTGFERVNALYRARDGSMWAAANNGLWRFYKGVWMANSIEEGLPSAVVYRVWEDRKGVMWVLTPSGVRQYHPEADQDPPRTTLTGVEVEKAASTDDPLVVRVAGRDKWKLTESKRLHFSWRLDQGAWSPYAMLGELTFRGLSSGPHQLEVRCMDRNWNEEVEPARLEFMALIPWYREPRVFAVGLCGLVVAIVLAAVAANRHFKLVRSYAEVERIVAVRTQELERANQELLHSHKMRALGTLAAGVAHDFNSILSIIKGSIQLIEANPDQKEKVGARVNRIKTAVEQGAGLVRAMLGLSRGSAEVLVPCHVNTLVLDVQRLFGDRFLNEATLLFEPAEPLPEVLGESDLIKQVLVNLIINASDAMQNKGRIVIRTGLVRDLPAGLPLASVGRGRHVFLKIVDEGCGISADVLSRIFEPFFTTKSFSTRRGTGLGLSMVYELCKEMGYGILVESVVGQGSTFTVFMPVAETEVSRDGERLG